MTPLEIMKEAREILTNPAQWTQGVYARDEAGCGVNWEDEAATCFCALGAIRKAGGEEWLYVDDAAIELLVAALPSDWKQKTDGMPPRPHYYNDDEATTHADVLAWFDRAIEIASEIN